MERGYLQKSIYSYKEFLDGAKPAEKFMRVTKEIINEELYSGKGVEKLIKNAGLMNQVFGAEKF